MKKTPHNLKDAHIFDGSEQPMNVGVKLRELRLIVGLTQLELAERINVSGSTISKAENNKDINLSFMRKYVSALGAQLKVGATFDYSSPILAELKKAFDVEISDEDQLVFPIIEDDTFKPQRDVVLSIKPKYSEPILQGLKTVELRRRFPIKVPSGTLAYIYSTSPTRALTGIAEIQSVSKIELSHMWEKYSKVAYIKRDDFDSYFSGLDEGYAIELKNARPLRRTIELAELRDRFEFQPPQSFVYVKPLLRAALKNESSSFPN